MAGPSRPGLNRRLERFAGVLSLLAGSVHGLVTPAHFAEWWGYGLFFVFAATAQVLFGIALLTNAVNANDFGPRWLAMKRALAAAGIVGNLLIMGVYVVTRTVGIPWFGPEAGEVEAVGPVDLVSKGLELALVVALALLWRRLARADAAIA